MADENNINPENLQAEDQRQVSILVQYVKDISFENPGAPQSLQVSEEKPNINVSVDVAAQKLDDNNYEVELKIAATAKREGATLFIAEVDYAGVFSMQNIPEEEIQPALLIFCPSLLFPYVRRVVSDLTRDGGFPALMLDPIDFAQLYQQRMEQMQNEQNEQEGQQEQQN